MVLRVIITIGLQNSVKVRDLKVFINQVLGTAWSYFACCILSHAGVRPVMIGWSVDNVGTSRVDTLYFMIKKRPENLQLLESFCYC